MNILLVSQCDKRALTETRRILDQFAERRGDRTWQTPITEAGLTTLRRLLRKTARKNTAVACHWIRGRDHSELLWIVGDTSRFNAQGAVPTNSTSRNIRHSEDENDWHTGVDIRLLAELAALLHDLGKASRAFQDRLRGKLKERNLFRHEWVSLRMFHAFVGDDDDEGWLRRLADSETSSEQLWIGAGRYQRDGLDASDAYPFRTLPPLAAAVAWLVVTHHRLPMVPVRTQDGLQAPLGRRSLEFNGSQLETLLSFVAHDWNELHQPAPREQIEAYWKPADNLPVVQPKWRARAARIARGLIELRRRREGNWLDNPYVMHLARLSLMLADHHYSSLPINSPQRIQGDRPTSLFANTDPNGQLKQPLDEHLLGVARDAGLIAHALPGFEHHLPRLARHRGLRKRSTEARFAWQDKAADAAASLRDAAREHGMFIVNMASTGCGKTLANARLLYALADPQQGMRATYALGLRTLTLQTGRSYRIDLQLDEDELAIRVGGSANRALFEFYEQKAEALGSASSQALIEEDGHVFFEGNALDHPLLSRALHDRDVRNLLSAPMLVCTVDHLAPATESVRAGRQIAPMLRLMSSDLVLDELDDYDLDDLPALTRLVHWAGLLGTRIVLSSATLPPALVEGMFMAYRAGRVHYRRNRGVNCRSAEQVEIPCLWVDEFDVHTAHCVDAEAFTAGHARFVSQRAEQLAKAVPLRRSELIPLQITTRQRSEIRAEFARHVLDASLRLHKSHGEICPTSGKRVSFGLVRMANINPLFDVAQSLFKLGAPLGTRIHLCVYHARFPLIQRSAIEHLLDTAFNRRSASGKAVYHVPAVRTAIDAHPEQDHLFVVLASPVCEVGRDWDADWAIAEPSSMRSLIQLAGRVQRHRRTPRNEPNVLIFDTNLRHYEHLGKDVPAFIHPGFEESGPSTKSPYRLETHRLGKLLEPGDYEVLTALPRIQPRAAEAWLPRQRFTDLEHARLAAFMLPTSRSAHASRYSKPAFALNATSAWQHARAALTGVLPQQQPFRDDALPTTTLVFLPDEDDERLVLHRIDKDRIRHGKSLYTEVEQSLRHDIRLEFGPRVDPWGQFDLMTLLIGQATDIDRPLRKSAEQFAVLEAPSSSQGWSYHPLLGFGAHA